MMKDWTKAFFTVCAYARVFASSVNCVEIGGLDRKYLALDRANLEIAMAFYKVEQRKAEKNDTTRN